MRSGESILSNLREHTMKRWRDPLTAWTQEEEGNSLTDCMAQQKEWNSMLGDGHFCCMFYWMDILAACFTGIPLRMHDDCGRHVHDR